MKPTYDTKTIRAIADRVNLVRHLSPEPKIPEKDPAAQAAYFAGWDDACEVLDRLCRKMTEAR